MSFFNGGNPDIGFYYSNRLYNGIGGGSSFYDNIQTKLPLRDPLTGRFIRTSPPSGFFREQAIQAPELPGLTGGTARQLNLFNQRPANIGNTLGSSYGGYRYIPSYGLQGDLFKSGYGFSGAQTNYSSVFSSSDVSLAPVSRFRTFSDTYSKSINSLLYSRRIAAGVGLLGAAYGDPKFNENVLVPSVVGGVGGKLVQNFGVTPLFQTLGSANILGFSRDAGNNTLFRGNPFAAKLPGFGAIASTAALASAGSQLFSSNIESVKYGQSAAGAVVGSYAGGYFGAGLGALSGNALISGAAGFAGSFIGGGIGAYAGNQLPVSGSLYTIADLQAQTQGNANSLVKGALSPLLVRPTGLKAFAEPFATALDFGFIAGPITEFPKRLAGLPTRGDVQSTLSSIALDARSGQGVFAGSGYNIAQRFAATAFAQSEGIGGPNALYRDQGIGGYTTRNSLAESVSGVGKDFYNALRDQHYSNREITALQAQYASAVSALYGKEQQQFQAVEAAQIREANRAFFEDPSSSIQRATRAVATQTGVQYRVAPQAVRALAQSLPSDLSIGAAPSGFFENLAKTSGGQASFGRGIDRFLSGVGQNIRNSVAGLSGNSIFSDVKRSVQLSEAAKTGAYARTLGSIATDASNTASAITGGRAARGGYAGRDYGAQYAARQAAIQADRTFSAGNRLLTQKFEEGLSTLTAPSYGSVRFDYRSVNAAVADLTPGSVLPEEFKQRYSQAYQQQLGVYQGNVASAQRDFAAFRENAQSGANRFIQQLRSRSAPTAAGRLDVETAASRIQTDLNRVLIRPSQEIEKLTKNVAELSKQMNPSTENSFAYFVAKTAKAAQSDTRFFQSQGVQTAVAGYRAANYQLETDRRLGIVSNERYIRETASNDRAALGQQYSLYKLNLSDYENRINAQTQTLRAPTFNAQTGRYDLPSLDRLNQADQLERSFGYYKSANQRYFDDQYERLSPEETNRRVKAAFGKDFQPYFNAIFKSAVRGVNPVSALGTQFSNSFSALGGSATANLLSNNKFVGDIFGPLIAGAASGDIRQLSKNLSARFGGGAPVPGSSGITLAGFATPDIAQKSISYGTIGYAASQQLANYLSPYQNQAVGSIGSLAGGLIGSAFGPIGTGVGSAIGGLLGAAPFTQNPIGGGLTGAAAGALAGSFLGPIGAIGGGLLGGLFGFLGGKQSQQKRDADRKAKQLAAFQAQVQGRNYAKSYLSGGVPYASDLFNGYGDYSQKLSAFQDYISPNKFASVAGSEIFDSQTLSYAKSAFGSYTNLFQPIENLADRYRSVISRPGSFQGAIFDVGLRNAQIPISGGAFSGGPASDLLSSFSNLQSSLGQYGFDPTRGNLAYSVFSGQYQNQLQGLDYQISQSNRDYQSILQSNALSATSRGIQTDITNRNLSTFERDSRNQIEAALGTLQRRENRSATVAQLKDDQAFQRDILTRQAALQSGTFAYQAQQDQYQSQDALKSLQDLTASRTILVDAFNQLAPKLTDASSEFYQMSEAIKEVNQQLELLSRNLR